jgi:hypothetical protein
MNSLITPVIDDHVNRYLNAMLDNFIRRVKAEAEGEGLLAFITELVLKERYPVNIHIKESSPTAVKQPSKPSKTYNVRGRKKNSTVKLTDLDLKQYTQAVLLTINDDKYLRDQYNLIYKFSNANEIVGHVVNQEILWF